MGLPPEDPLAGPWRVVPIPDVVRTLRGHGGPGGSRLAVVGIDGRSSSGKTTLARRMAESVGAVSVVHTDDLAWHHSVFGWVDLLVGGVLEPLREGRDVSYRPPAWDERDRPGSITVPAETDLLVVEGVGAGRRELSRRLDATVWVQSDPSARERRDRERIDAGEVTEAVHGAWMAEEATFLAEDRPWARADLIVAGTPELPHDPATEVVVAEPIDR